MTSYFSVKAQYDKMMEDGLQKRITESFLFEAATFGDAETRAVAEISPYCKGWMTILEIKKYKLNDMVLNEDGDKFYLVKINVLTFDEKQKKDKKAPMYILAQATDISGAKKGFEDAYKNTMFDYSIEKIEETKILDVFPIPEP